MARVPVGNLGSISRCPLGYILDFISSQISTTDIVLFLVCHFVTDCKTY